MGFGGSRSSDAQSQLLASWNGLRRNPRALVRHREVEGDLGWGKVPKITATAVVELANVEICIERGAFFCHFKSVVFFRFTFL